MVGMDHQQLQTATHVHAQKLQFKSQTFLLIFTKSAPSTTTPTPWLYLSFVIRVWTGEWPGVKRVRLLFQHLPKGAGRAVQDKRPPLTQLLNPHHTSPHLIFLEVFFFLFYLAFFLSSKTQIKCVMDE